MVTKHVLIDAERLRKDLKRITKFHDIKLLYIKDQYKEIDDLKEGWYFLIQRESNKSKYEFFNLIDMINLTISVRSQIEKENNRDNMWIEENSNKIFNIFDNCEELVKYQQELNLAMKKNEMEYYLLNKTDKYKNVLKIEKIDSSSILNANTSEKYFKLANVDNTYTILSLNDLMQGRNYHLEDTERIAHDRMNLKIYFRKTLILKPSSSCTDVLSFNIEENENFNNVRELFYSWENSLKDNFTTFHRIGNVFEDECFIKEEWMKRTKIKNEGLEKFIPKVDEEKYQKEKEAAMQNLGLYNEAEFVILDVSAPENINNKNVITVTIKLINSNYKQKYLKNNFVIVPRIVEDESIGDYSESVLMKRVIGFDLILKKKYNCGEIKPIYVRNTPFRKKEFEESVVNEKLRNLSV